MSENGRSSRNGLAGFAPLAAAATLALGAAGTALAGAADKDLGADGLALEGYDPVAYFTEGEPTEGSAEFTATVDGATYRFANADNLAAFEEDPEAYLPAYGGYCAYGLAMGQKVGSDPEVWEIVDGQLYLNVNQDVQERWEANIPGFVRTADHNWSVVADVPAERLKEATPAGIRLGAAE
jgi:YHS domain-containing protein